MLEFTGMPNDAPIAAHERDRHDYWRGLELVFYSIEIGKGEAVYLASLESISPALGLLYAVHMAQSEICNGGFDQFFYNSTGVLAPEAVTGFATIGLLQASETVRRAMEMLGSPYPRDRAERQARLSKLHSEAFNALHEKFYEFLELEAGGFQSAANLYAKTLR